MPASKKQKSNSSTLADSKGKRVRENKMYMVLSTSLYIYILSAVFFHVRPPRFGSVVKAAATGAAGRFSVSLYKKWYKNWLKTIFFVGKIQEKGVEVSAKYITKICIVVKIQWKKRYLGQNTIEKGVVVSAKYITKKGISGKIK